MIFDTDIFIWIQKGNLNAAHCIEKENRRFLSLQSYLELLQCAQNRVQHQKIKSFIKDFSIQVLPLTENIGHRALIYIEEYSISHGLRAGDAIIAATAVEHGEILCSSNFKHFKSVNDLKLKVFKP